MNDNLSLYKIYKNTTLAVVIAGVLILGGAFAYVVNTNSSFFNTKKNLQEVSHKTTGQVVSQGTSEKDKAMSTESNVENKDLLILNAEDADSQYLWIPVPDAVTSSDIMIENHYMDRELWVSMIGENAAFYDNEAISGNLQGIAYGEVVQIEDRLILKFALNQVYEFNTIFEDGVLYVEKVSPRQLYDRILIVDPCGLVSDEAVAENSLPPSKICLDIALKLQELLEKENIRVYMTSMDERELTDDDRINLASDVRPDMFVRIETGFNEDSKVYGTETVYNGTYFIPGFGSVELADLLESDVTTAIGGRASGLVEAGEGDVVIQNATVPAASVKVGYYTNTQENILLNRDDYRSKIALGIFNAVMDGFAVKNGE